MKETLKNFIVGLFVAVAACVFLALGFILWPFIIGIGSLVLFVLVAIMFIVLLFYIIVLLGYIVRNGLKGQ